MATRKAPVAGLAAEYFSLRANACELVEKYEKADLVVPRRLLVFAGVKPRRRAAKGPKPMRLKQLAGWFAARDNAPATYREIAAGLHWKIGQVRSCISRNEAEAFERAGEEKVGDRVYAKVRLSAIGLTRVEKMT